MKIDVASDLHLEWLSCSEQVEQVADHFKGEADVLVLAGDIVSARWRDSLLQMKPICQKYRDVVYVLGNHEYYDTNALHQNWIFDVLREELPNLHALHNTAEVIQGQKFYGGTMWFPNLPGNGFVKDLLSDFAYIKAFEPWVYRNHEAFVVRARELVDEDTIVVTHHLPSEKSVPLRFKSRVPGVPDMNRFFVADQEELIRTKQPKLWIHGHTHEPCQYSLGRTQIACNPHGYPTESRSSEFSVLTLDA